MASLLFAFGSWLIGQGAWIHIKAEAAQWLLQRAWQETLVTQQPVKPWSWADTWPIGRLVVARLNIDQIILVNASGQSLAFGPGKVRIGLDSIQDTQNIILSGHRDTHFSFMQDVQLGDRLMVQNTQGEWFSFTVKNMEVMDSRIQPLVVNEAKDDLRLVTCYPFDALSTGAPLRYVVQARRTQPVN